MTTSTIVDGCFLKKGKELSKKLSEDLGNEITTKSYHCQLLYLSSPKVFLPGQCQKHSGEINVLLISSSTEDRVIHLNKK